MSLLQVAKRSNKMDKTGFSFNETQLEMYRKYLTNARLYDIWDLLHGDAEVSKQQGVNRA